MESKAESKSSALEAKSDDANVYIQYESEAKLGSASVEEEEVKGSELDCLQHCIRFCESDSFQNMIHEFKGRHGEYDLQRAISMFCWHYCRVLHWKARPYLLLLYLQ